MEYPPVAKETDTYTRTFALGDLSPKLSEESKDVRPLNVSRDRMRKDGLKSFEIFPLHMILVPLYSTKVMNSMRIATTRKMHLTNKSLGDLLASLSELKNNKDFAFELE